MKWLHNHTKKGFTLIELLVVLAVIGILAAVIVASINSARVKSRNTRRISDVRQIATAFSMAINDGKTIPALAHACLSPECTPAGFFSPNASLDALIAPYMTAKPIDPAGGTRNFTGYAFMIAGGISYVYWTMEGSNTAGVCSPGRVNTHGTGYVECLLQVHP